MQKSIIARKILKNDTILIGKSPIFKVILEKFSKKFRTSSEKRPKVNTKNFQKILFAESTQFCKNINFSQIYTVFGQTFEIWPDTKFLGQTVSNLAKFLEFGQEKAKLAALLQSQDMKNQ